MDKSEKDVAREAGGPSARAGHLSSRTKGWMVVLLVLIAIVAFLGLLPVQICRDYAFVCEDTGSHKGYRQWCIGWRSGQWYRESRLEQFMRQQHPSELAYRWISYSGTGKNILGWHIRYGHGDPRLSSLMMSRKMFDRYVDTLDDAAKLDLYRVLVSGGRDALSAEEKKMEAMLLAQAGPLQ